MSHASVFNQNQPNNGMKKKAMIAVATVVVGHIAVLGLLSQMKVQTLKPVHKDPVKVRFVKIQPPPAPPKPKEKPKEKPKPVKEVKIVKQQLPPPPKKVEKVQQVKAEAPKQVIQPPVTKPTPVVSTTVSETKTVVKPVEPAPVVKPVEPAAPPADKSPKSVSIGGSGVQWSRSPSVQVSPSDLKDAPRSIVVAIEANEKGVVTSVRIVKSSGLPALDEKVMKAVRSAKFKPYKENGVAYPIRANQPFDLN
ncbi:TonB family protein [Acinetobacter sp. MD2]|uniref:TonB family protein n=1 Tax=Acinetobacter sp. MD2 TaxID=2600066 RepID=UPI002D1F022E|nr:TonB family protein [Acinetobacter sp. MD2]MEB3768125.1 TonB family protein [Acinetobacter sp. MD2]